MKACITRAEVKNYADERPAAKIRLDLTSNPLGPPRIAVEKLLNDVGSYPETAELPALLSALSNEQKLSTEEIMLTAGADQGIEIALTHLLEPKGRVAILVPTFPRFEIVARQLCDAEVIRFDSLEKLPGGCDAVILCTPNNPTTEELDVAALCETIAAHPESFFVVDGVFAAFGSQNLDVLVRRFPNVALLQSLSKSHGLAGLRVGWIASRAENIAAFRQGVSPFRVPLLCQRIALDAVQQKEHLRKSKAFLEAEFDRIREALGTRARRQSGVPFFLFLTEQPREEKERLLREGIAVTDSTSFPGVREQFLRIMIGTREENDAVIRALKTPKQRKA